MNLSRRLFALLIPLALLLSACGTNDDPGAAAGGSSGGSSEGGQAGGEPVAEGPATGDLTVWAMGAEGEKASTLADAFMEENPDVNVTVTPVPWDVAHDKLLTAVAGQQTPDVSQMGTTFMGEFAETGALDEVPASFDPGAFFDGAWETNVVDGQTYGVPWYIETRLLYYRSDIAEKAGITEAPQTWDELKAMAEAMQSEGGAEYGIALGPNNWQEFMPFVWSNGGDVVDEEGNFALDSPQATEALAFYDSFFEEGLTAESVPEGFDITPAFVQGTHPMFFSGPWHLGLIKDVGGKDIEGKWAVAPMPSKESATSFVGGSNLSVFANSDNRDAAWKFVEFVSRPEVQVDWYSEVAALPAVEAAWDDETLTSDQNVAAFGEQLESAKAQPSIPTWVEVETAINSEMEKVTVGNATPEEGAAAMQAAAESVGTGE